MITELVLNHTSDQHPWFQRARRAPAGSPERDFYVWSDTPEKYQDARVIFQDFEPSNWTLGPGRQGVLLAPLLRASARPQLRQPGRLRRPFFPSSISGSRWASTACGSTPSPTFSSARGPTARTCPRPISSSRALRAHVDARFPGRMFLAEANQWPEDAVAYFGKGDECHMAFHFPLMPRLFMAPAPGRPVPDPRHHGPDAGHPGNLPVVPVPPQPRRADPGDGDG